MNKNMQFSQQNLIFRIKILPFTDRKIYFHCFSVSSAIFHARDAKFRCLEPRLKFFGIQELLLWCHSSSRENCNWAIISCSRWRCVLWSTRKEALKPWKVAPFRVFADVFLLFACQTFQPFIQQSIWKKQPLSWMWISKIKITERN